MTQTSDEIREKLAALEHQQWAHWTKYMLDNMTDENIERWRVQIETPYDELTDAEKNSDRSWAMKVIRIMQDDLVKSRKDGYEAAIRNYP